jgi:hypothetical protein
MSASLSTYSDQMNGLREFVRHGSFERCSLMAVVTRTMFEHDTVTTVAMQEGGAKVLASLARAFSKWTIGRAGAWYSLSEQLTSGWSQETETAVPLAFQAAAELTDVERDRILRSVIASQALEGITVTRDTAERLLDQALRMPLPDLD